MYPLTKKSPLNFESHVGLRTGFALAEVCVQWLLLLVLCMMSFNSKK